MPTSPIAVPAVQALAEGLDLTRKAVWARCPFCGGEFVCGWMGEGIELRHSAPQCETFQRDAKTYWTHAKKAGGVLHPITPQKVEAISAASTPHG